MTICDSILDRMAISMTLIEGFHTDAAHNCLVMVVVGKAIGLNAVDSTHGRTYLRTRFLEPFRCLDSQCLQVRLLPMGRWIGRPSL